MTQDHAAGDSMHHVLCEDQSFRVWSNEPSESSARAHADEQTSDPHVRWAAVWIIPCTGEAVCPVCVAHRRDVNEDEVFRSLTADREPYWERLGPR